MAKLDLSALKKQKIQSGNQLASVPVSIAETPASLPETAETPASLPETVAVASPAAVLPAVAIEPEAKSPQEVSHKPKLSLASFKKPGSIPAVAPASAAMETPVVSQVTKEVAPPVVSSLPTEISQPVPTVSLAIEPEPATAPKIAAEPVAEPAPIAETKAFPVEVPAPKALVTDKKSPAASSEFFPNLEFENDFLFKDIAEMGSFGSENEVVEKPAVAEAVVPNPTPIRSATSEAEIQAVTADSVAPVSSKETASPQSAVLLSMEQVVAEAASKEEIFAVEPLSEATLVASAVAPAPVPAIPLEYVEAVAKDLSKDRKGGLSELFDKRKKVIYGMAAMVVSLGIVGSLYGFGILDLKGEKASVTEPPVVAVVTPKLPKIPLVPPADTAVPPVAGSGVSTGSIVPAVPFLTGATAVAGTGAILPPIPEWTGALLASTGAVAIAPATGSGIILRKPTANVKRTSIGSVSLTGSGSKLPAITGTGAAKPPIVPLPTSTGAVKPVGTGALALPPSMTGAKVAPPSVAPSKTSVNPTRTPNVSKKKTVK